MSQYLDAILEAQAERKVAGRTVFTPAQTEAAFQGDIAARYTAGTAARSEAEREKEFSQSLAFQREQMQTQKDIGQQQTIVGGVGAIGQLGLGYAAAKHEGLFGDAAIKGTGGQTAITGAGAAGAAGVGGSMLAEGTPLAAYSAGSEGAGIATVGTQSGVVGGGASLGAVGSAAGYAGAGAVASYYGGKALESMSGGEESYGIGARIGRTMQSPFEGPGPSATDKLFGTEYAGREITNVVQDFLNPAGSLVRMSGIGKAVGCGIIMTAIHGSDSPEVDVCRRYRNKFLTDQQLRAYIEYYIFVSSSPESVLSVYLNPLYRLGFWLFQVAAIALLLNYPYL